MSTIAAAPGAAAPGKPFLARPVPGEPTLAVVVYHYVRDVRGTRFPNLKCLPVSEFRNQVRTLAQRYEMATVESALAFLSGGYSPPRSLCLLTFDDGLKDHCSNVLPILRALRIEGVFFVSTASLDGRVAGVHKSHHLLGGQEFSVLREAFMNRIHAWGSGVSVDVDDEQAVRAYPWDSLEVARFKYLLNYQLPVDCRDQVLDALFAEFVGSEGEFAESLYLTRDELRAMQSDGMVVGGHSHNHLPLSDFDGMTQRADVGRCAARLRGELRPQRLWPFSYPYGYFSPATIQIVQQLGFDCAFALAGGANEPTQHAFQIRRIDTKDLLF